MQKRMKVIHGQQKSILIFLWSLGGVQHSSSGKYWEMDN